MKTPIRNKEARAYLALSRARQKRRKIEAPLNRRVERLELRLEKLGIDAVHEGLLALASSIKKVKREPKCSTLSKLVVEVEYMHWWMRGHIRNGNFQGRKITLTIFQKANLLFGKAQKTVFAVKPMVGKSKSASAFNKALQATLARISENYQFSGSLLTELRLKLQLGDNVRATMLGVE